MFLRVCILVTLGIINMAVFCHMIWGPTGIVQYRNIKKQYQDLQQKISDLDTENVSLSRQIRLLESDNQYYEKMIRQRLHYLRANELLYIFDTKADNLVGGAYNEGKN